MSDIRRREFIAALGAAMAWPLTARAQQGERMRRIGILMPYLPTNAEMQARVRAFHEELRKRGWAASVNAQFDERWTSDNMDLIRSAAANGALREALLAPAATCTRVEWQPHRDAGWFPECPSCGDRLVGCSLPSPCGLSVAFLS